MINDLRDAGLLNAVLERLADADAIRSIGLDRRKGLWEVSTKDRPIQMFSGYAAPDQQDENITLPKMITSEHIVQDYVATSFSLKSHPVSLVREKLERLHVVPINSLSTLQNGDAVKVSGLVLVRQRPETGKGVCFMTKMKPDLPT